MRDKPLFITSVIFLILYGIFILAIFSPLKRVFSPFITAIGLVYLFLPLVEKLIRLKIKAVFAVLLIYLLIAITGGFTIIYAAPKIYTALSEIGGVLTDFLEEINVYKYLSQIAPDGARGVYTTIVSAARWFFDFFVGVVAAFYILSDTRGIKRAFKELVPVKLIPPFKVLLDDIRSAFDAFFKGQILIALILFVIDGIFLYAVGVDYAWGLAFIAAALDIVPYAGAFLAMGIIIVVTVISSPGKIFIVIAGLLIIQQIENNIITPRVSSTTLALHPALTVLCLYVGSFGGFWGILLAIPLTCVFKKICERTIQSLV